MTLLEQWLRRPRSVWLRRALFQVHLWTGLGLGIYVLVVSVTGSAIVFRNDIYRYFGSEPTLVPPRAEKLDPDALRSAAEAQHPGYRVTSVFEGRTENQAVEIWLDRDGSRTQRLFDPYTGEDLGPAVPMPIRVAAWLGDLHINLLYGRTGQTLNGVGGLLVSLLALTGACVWWPGIDSWRRSLWPRWSASWRRFNWDLHSVIGFWGLGLVLMWALTGIVVSLPGPYSALVDYLDPVDLDAAVFERRFGDQLFRWLAWAHFGTFGGWPVKVLWTVLGLVPAVLFVTGVVMWWNRVLRRSA